MNRHLQAAQEIARQAGDLLLDEFQKSHKFEYKGGVEIVTAADRRSEEFIVERLRTFFPPHAIIGEEGGERATLFAEVRVKGGGYVVRHRKGYYPQPQP